MLQCEAFHSALVEKGISFFTGVPDSLLKDFCFYLIDHTEPRSSVIAANEGNAVALAAGHFLATGFPALVYMQNSGLGNAINPLTSLVDSEIFGIPVLLLIGWRGEPGEMDEPQHIKEGAITLPMLEILGIAYRVLPDELENAISCVDEAIAKMNMNPGPYALIVRKGTFGSSGLHGHDESVLELKREDAVKILADSLEPQDAVIATTGKASRELFEHQLLANPEDLRREFLNVGSMGHTSQVALGVALDQPDRTVFCLDGDGALLMHMGSLAIIGTHRPSNFKHVVINNRAHDSVGGHPTGAPGVDIPSIALACGYRAALSAATRQEMLSALRFLKLNSGPSLLEVRVGRGGKVRLGKTFHNPKGEQGSLHGVSAAMKQEVLFEEGAINQLDILLSKIAPERVLLVTGDTAYTVSGAEAALKDILQPYYIYRFSEYGANPTLEDVLRGLAVLEEIVFDVVVAIGGGSALDVAKLIGILAAQDASPNEVLEDQRTIRRRGPPLVALPTTAGSGSEATHFATIYINKIKRSIAHRYMLPVAAIIDPALTYSMPPRLSAVTGMDALSQAIESLWCVNSTNESRNYAKEALQLAVHNLEGAAIDQSRRARHAMCKAAHMAGRAINITKTTAPHALSYAMTSFFGISHGHAVGLTLGEFLVHNSDVRDEDVADPRGAEFVRAAIDEIGGILGAKCAMAACTKLKDLMRSVGLETRLGALGINDEKDIDLIVKSIDPARLAHHPRLVRNEDVRRILHRIT